MDQRFFIILRCQFIIDNTLLRKMISQKEFFPFADDIKILKISSGLTVKFRDKNNDLQLIDGSEIIKRKGIYFLKSKKNIHAHLCDSLINSKHLLFLIEGSRIIGRKWER